MKQLRIFEVTKDDFEFLARFREAKKERLKWIELYHDIEDLKKRYLSQLNILNESVAKEKIINFQDIANRKKVLEALSELEKLTWIRGKVEAIEIWIDQNSFRASNMN